MVIAGSDIIHLKYFNVHIVVLGSSDAIFEVLDKRSSVTSDRMPTPMNEL